jgi:hypothetical protein
MRKLTHYLLLIAGMTSMAVHSAVHQSESAYMSYRGLIMTGYQGWFRAPGDGSGRGWVHWGKQGQFDERHCSVDFWPDVSEYEVSYPTVFRNPDGTQARVFSSYDRSTTDVHFRWMREYDVDGAFMQRFYVNAKNRNFGKDVNGILQNAWMPQRAKEERSR